MAFTHKRCLFLLLPLLALLSGCRYQERYVADARDAGGPVVVDGITERCWDKADWHSITEFVYDKQTTPRSIGAKFKVLWDRTRCYLFFSVRDDIKYKHELPANKVEQELDFYNHLNENDCILLYFFKSGYVYGEDHDVYLYRLIYDFNEASIGFAVDEKYKKQVKFAQQDTSTGYSMEISIPWESMGLIPAAGDKIGFKAWVIDNDNVRLQPGLLPFSESALSWSGADAVDSKYYGTINLVQ